MEGSDLQLLEAKPDDPLELLEQGPSWFCSSEGGTCQWSCSWICSDHACSCRGVNLQLQLTWSGLPKADLRTPIAKKELTSAGFTPHSWHVPMYAYAWIFSRFNNLVATAGALSCEDSSEEIYTHFLPHPTHFCHISRTFGIYIGHGVLAKRFFGRFYMLRTFSRHM
jgi:hypothetical protein